jgi:hypothetical protein
MHVVAIVLVTLLIAALAGLAVRSIRNLVLVTALMLGIGRGQFRIRLTRIAGEVSVAACVVYFSSKLIFYGGKLEPQKATHAALHINIPFLHWFATTFGIVILALGVIVITAAYGFAAWVQYDMVTPLREAKAEGRRPIYVRVALFNTGIIFCSRRAATTWLRTELSCLALSMLAGMSSGAASELEFVQDKTFRRILGSTALDWPTVIRAATAMSRQPDYEEGELPAEIADLAGEPLEERAMDIVHGHTGH